MSFLELQNLSLRYGPRVALDNLSLAVRKGEFFSLLGPSGCGKTTTIRLIAGFLQPDSGTILLEGQDIRPLSPDKRNMGMVFQSYALFPHLRVFDNVAFGLKARKVASPEIPAKVRRALDLVNLSGSEARSIFELSGGEQQRVAIARAIVIEPRVLLLDEPLSNLDASLRETTRRQLKHLAKSLGITTIFVTHDQEEAFAISDRVALLWQGTCQQVGTPRQLYHRPASEFVARFIGKSTILSLPCKSIENGNAILALPWGGTLSAPLGSSHWLRPGMTCKVMFRPEALQFQSAGHLSSLGEGRILEIQYTGSLSELTVEIQGVHFLVIVPNRSLSQIHSVGEEVQLFCSTETVQILP
ncbi:MAG TPA: ABC transporter ATP-binding protein [Terriglobia bacterium]|nr:ABC transporter ATP-binding protein [Terriglobia bacterium]